MKRTWAFLSVLVLGLAWAQTYTLRFNHVLGPNHPYHAGFQTWAERVAQRTNGNLRILVFHSASWALRRTSSSSSARVFPWARTRTGLGSATT